MNPSPVPTPAAVQAAAPAARQAEYRTAPLEDQIAALERAADRTRHYHAKIMATGRNVNATWNRLEEWRLESAIRSLKKLHSAGGAA